MSRNIVWAIVCILTIWYCGYLGFDRGYRSVVEPWNAWCDAFNQGVREFHEKVERMKKANEEIFK